MSSGTPETPEISAAPEKSEPQAGLGVPDTETTRRRREVALAGHQGRPDEAIQALNDPAPAVRAAALEALCRMSLLTSDHLSEAMSDPSPVVRCRAAELCGRINGPANSAPPGAPDGNGPGLALALVALLDDPEASVVGAASFGLGELGEAAGDLPEVTAALGRTSRDHPDPLCRETAVAALGAIGDPAGLDAVLAAMTDKPAVRRRAVLALSAFEGEKVETALRGALSDRDWQVRQAAEDLIGRD